MECIYFSDITYNDYKVLKNGPLFSTHTVNWLLHVGGRTCQYISTCLVSSPVLMLRNEPIARSGAAAGTTVIPYTYSDINARIGIARGGAGGAGAPPQSDEKKDFFLGMSVGMRQK